MNRLITRQPALLLKSSLYVEKELTRYIRSFCYEFTLSKNIVMVPNSCIDYIWNMDKKKLYCFEDITSHMEFTAAGERLFGIHMDSLYICEYDRKSLELWMERVGDFSTFEERVAYCDEQLGTVMHIEKVHPFVRHAIEQIEEARGKVTVEAIAAEFGYTPRHMERLFLQTFSYGPKRFCRYIRLLNAISNMMQFPDRNISYHIENLGYSDQAHFQREFKTFMGMTPKQFMKQYVNMD